MSSGAESQPEEDHAQEGASTELQQQGNDVPRLLQLLKDFDSGEKKRGVEFPENDFSDADLSHGEFKNQMNLTGIKFSDKEISRMQISTGPISRMQISTGPISRMQSSEGPISRMQSSEGPISRMQSSTGPISRLHSSIRPISRMHISNTPISSMQTSNRPISRMQTSKRPISRMHGSTRPNLRVLNLSVHLLIPTLTSPMQNSAHFAPLSQEHPERVVLGG